MSTCAYQEAMEKIQQLTRQEKLKLIEEVAASLQQEVEERPLHDIMEFKGMAKKVWEGIDVEAYLNEERNSWDRKTHKITELEGLGKEIWEGVDAQEYVNQERDTWDERP